MSPSDAPSSASSTEPASSKHEVKRRRKTVGEISSTKPKEIVAEAYGRSSPLNSNDDSDSESSSNSDDAEPNHGIDHALSQETEVLSHAAQRKLRKKTQKEEKLLGQAASSGRPQDDAADTSQKRQNSIWVGNLAFKTTEQALRAFFQRGVPGCEITRVNLPTKSASGVDGRREMRGENRGFAYIDFMTNEEREKAITLSEQPLDGRKLLIKDGSDFTGRPTAISTTSAATVESRGGSGVMTSMVGKSKTAQRILAAQKQPPAPTLFLGNLGFQATEQSIQEMIEAHMKGRQVKIANEKDAKSAEIGNPVKDKILKKVRLGTFEDSGLCKGFAFIDFATTEDATAALLDPRNHHLDGRKLVVEYASADAVRRGGGPGAKTHREKKEIPVKGKTSGHRTGQSSRNDNKTGTSSKREFEDTAAGGEGIPPAKRQKRDESKQKEDRGSKSKRSKPGAALALARREKVSIVPSSGKKIVF